MTIGQKISDLIAILREIMNSNVNMIIAWVLEIIGIIHVILFVCKNKALRRFASHNTTKNIFVIIFIMIIELLAPVFLIFKSLSWTGWEFWVTQLLFWSVLLGFIGAIIFILWIQISLAKLKINMNK